MWSEKRNVKGKYFSANPVETKLVLRRKITQQKEPVLRMIQTDCQLGIATTKQNVGANLVQNTTLHTKRLSSGLHRLMSFLIYSGRNQKGVLLTVLTLLGTTSRGMLDGLHMQSRLKTAYHGGIG